jgi:hypothetical protein
VATGRAKQIDAKVGADTSIIDEVKTKVEEFRSRIARIPGLKDIITVLAVGFVVTAVSHLGGRLDRAGDRAPRTQPGAVQSDKQIFLDCGDRDDWWSCTLILLSR